MKGAIGLIAGVAIVLALASGCGGSDPGPLPPATTTGVVDEGRDDAAARREARRERQRERRAKRFINRADRTCSRHAKALEDLLESRGTDPDAASAGEASPEFYAETIALAQVQLIELSDLKAPGFMARDYARYIAALEAIERNGVKAVSLTRRGDDSGAASAEQSFQRARERAAAIGAKLGFRTCR